MDTRAYLVGHPLKKAHKAAQRREIRTKQKLLDTNIISGKSENRAAKIGEGHE
jgi:hypothetical protein